MSTTAEDVLSPRESGEHISQHSKDVAVVEDAMSEAAQQIFTQMKEKKYSFKAWKEEPVHPNEMTEASVDWIFVIDTLNFSFWLPGEKQFQLEHEGVVYEDYQALCMAINRALKEGIPLTTPSYYKTVTLETMKHVFRSCNDTTLPLLEQRTLNLNTNGKILCDSYNGSFVNVLKECNGDVRKFIAEVTQLFPSFRDTGVFHGQPVAFYKRVQILCADIWACFEGVGYGRFTDISELTMFADYRVPQSLQALGVLRYSDGLLGRLREGVELESGCIEEMEIRGCSIYCVELLCAEVKKIVDAARAVDRGDARMVEMTVNSVLLDFYLWDYATHHNPEGMVGYPEHRTRSTFY